MRTPKTNDTDVKCKQSERDIKLVIILIIGIADESIYNDILTHWLLRDLSLELYYQHLSVGKLFFKINSLAHEYVFDNGKGLGIVIPV